MRRRLRRDLSFFLSSDSLGLATWCFRSAMVPGLGGDDSVSAHQHTPQALVDIPRSHAATPPQQHSHNHNSRNHNSHSKHSHAQDVRIGIHRRRRAPWLRASGLLRVVLRCLRRGPLRGHLTTIAARTLSRDLRRRNQPTATTPAAAGTPTNWSGPRRMLRVRRRGRSVVGEVAVPRGAVVDAATGTSPGRHRCHGHRLLRVQPLLLGQLLAHAGHVVGAAAAAAAAGAAGFG